MNAILLLGGTSEIGRELASRLREQGLQVDVNHRDLDLEQSHWKML